MSIGFFGTRLKIGAIVLAILVSPVFWLSGQEPRSQETPIPDVSTMSGMHSLVATLVAVGWENFFLDLRQDLKLSSQQSQQLYFIRQRYFAERDLQEKELDQARLSLYRDLDRDQVSSSKLESDLKTIGELKAEISALHFTAAIEAVNVLDHRQHQRAEDLLKVRLEEMWRQTPSQYEVRTTTVLRTLRAHLISRPKWLSNFTPRELGWRGW